MNAQGLKLGNKADVVSLVASGIVIPYIVTRIRSDGTWDLSELAEMNLHDPSNWKDVNFTILKMNNFWYSAISTLKNRRDEFKRIPKYDPKKGNSLYHEVEYGVMIRFGNSIKYVRLRPSDSEESFDRCDDNYDEKVIGGKFMYNQFVGNTLRQCKKNEEQYVAMMYSPSPPPVVNAALFDSGLWYFPNISYAAKKGYIPYFSYGKKQPEGVTHPLVSRMIPFHTYIDENTEQEL
jgi:hypothetical protein